MQSVTMKQIKDEVFNKFILADTYVKFNNYEFDAGKAIFDTERGMVVRSVSDDYTLITNKDLIKWIKSEYSVKFLNIYKTPSMDTVYIEGYLPEFSFTDYLDRQFYISFEVGNSYSSRFLPCVYLGIFYPLPYMNIKTTVRVTSHKRNDILLKPFDPDDTNGLIDLAQSTNEDSCVPQLMHDLLYSLPEKLRLKAQQMAILYGHKRHAMDMLQVAASIANVWKLSAYELSRTFQMNQFHHLIERISANDSNK